MRSLRGNGPLLLLVAVVAGPELLKKCKPLGRVIGDVLIKAGETINGIVGTEEPAAPPKDEMNKQDPNATTKVGAGTEEQDLDTASPIGHEEVEAQIAAEAKGDGAVPEPIDPVPHQEDKPLEPDQTRNPHRQQNSQPE